MGKQATITNDTDDQRYELRLDGELAAFAHYTPSEGVLDFDETQVLEEFKGTKGLGTQLVTAALKDVRARGENKVKATCPFVVSFFQRNPEFADLLAE